MGPLVIRVPHAYDDCFENADKLIQRQYTKNLPATGLRRSFRQFHDQRVQDDKIVVNIQHLPLEVINCYSGKSASQLYRQIAADCPSLQVEHAMYLGELQKAEIAVSKQQGFVYEQDKLLGTITTAVKPQI